MPTENVTTKFRVDISDLKKNITEANKQIKLARAEFKNATAGTDDWSKSADGLTAKIQAQNKIVDAEKSKLDALKQQLDRLNQSQQKGEQIIADLTAEYNNAVKTYGETSNEAKAYAKQLADAQAAQERNTKAADDLNVKILNQDTAVKKAQSELGKYENALADLGNNSETLTQKIERQESELQDLKTRYADVAGEQGKTSDEAKDLASKISDLSGELKENKDKLSEASDAADELDKSIDDAGKAAEGAANGGFTVFKGVLSNLLTGVINKLTGAITDLGSEAIDNSDAMAKFEQTMGFAGYDDKAIKTARDNVQDYADKTVYNLDTIANTTAQLAANGIDDYTGLTQAAGNLNAVAGGNADTFKSVAMVMTQTAGAGKLTTENWNQLADAVPGASGVLQKALKDAGAYTGDFREAMADGQITADEFNKAIMELGSDPVAVEAATSTETFEGAIGNLKATAVNGFMQIYDTIGRENVTKAITKASKLIEKIIPPIQKAVKWFIKNIPNITTAVVALGTAVGTYLAYTTAVQIMTKGWKSLAIAQKAVTAAQWLMNAAMNANPIGIIVAAIAGLVAAFVLLWKKSESFRNFWKGVWDKIKAVAMPIIDAIKNAFQAFWDFIKPIIDLIKDKIFGAIEEIKEMFTAFWEMIKAIWDLVAPYFTAIWDNVKAVFSGVIEFFSGIFSAAWDAIKLVWDVVSGYFSVIWESIKAVFSVVKEVLSGFFSTAWEAIKAIWDTVTGYFKMIWNNIKAIFSVVKDVLTGNFSGAWEGIKKIFANVKTFFSGVWNSIKNVFSSVGTWFKSIFSTAWTNIKNVFSKVGDFFGGIWNTIKSKFKSIGTKVADAIGGAFKSAINAVIGTVEKAINFIPRAINKAIKLINKLPGVEISKMPTIELPRLAKGGIVNRSTLAEVGENGAEAIIPLEKNKAGLKKIASLLAGEMGGATMSGKTTGGNVTYTFNQTNNSPKALSRYEIYRQTKNLINAAKGV